MFKGTDDFCGIEVHIVLDLFFISIDATEEIATLNKFHLDVDVFLVMKRA